jgi:hypothetical protein
MPWGEPYQSITFENRTVLPVKVILYRVSLDYDSNPTQTWNESGDVIYAGESKTLVTQVPNVRRGGLYHKYAMVAVTEDNEILLSKVYTWDELHDLDWRVIIE